MKNLILILILALIAMSGSSQNLIDIYKKGTVHLVPDENYGLKNDWDEVLETNKDPINSTSMVDSNSLIVLPDGSVVVNHKYRNFYSKFSPDGTFQKVFNVTRSNGEVVENTNAIEGIINNNTFFTGTDITGNILCFDFDGNYKKTLVLDYMTRQMIALPNNKIAVVGRWASGTDKARDFIALVDYNTNEEKIVWDNFTDRKRTVDFFVTRDGAVITSPPSVIEISTVSTEAQIACVNNELVVVHPTTGEISIYDLEGNLISNEKLDWTINYISAEELKAAQQKAIDNYKTIATARVLEWANADEYKSAIDSIVHNMESDLAKITDPQSIPMVATIIKDSDDNLLIFEYPKKEGANKFHVWIYENSGQFVGECTFVCDDYELEINPSKMVFHDGYIYALQKKKNTSGVPLRLVRFRLM